MDLLSFRHIVDSYSSGIPACQGDLISLYNYVGIAAGNSLTTQAVNKAIREKINTAFTFGHRAAKEQCRKWLDELIQDHILDNASLDPYFAVLHELRDGLKASGQLREEISGSWVDAIHHACDEIALWNWTPPPESRERTHTRTFEVAKAAKRLKEYGFQISRDANNIFLDDIGETKVVEALETLIARIGGLNVARRIFFAIDSVYDNTQERYHLVPRPQPSGGGLPQIPFGYMLLLAAKHLHGVKPYQNTEENWHQLCRIATDYTAVFDVQPYTQNIVLVVDPIVMIRQLQEMAIYDLLFRPLQAKGNDVIKIAKGLLKTFDWTTSRGRGWSIDAVLKVSQAILTYSHSKRGPVSIETPLLKKLCSDISPEMVDIVVAEVLCHPITGPNQKFSKPSDAPTSTAQADRGHDFFMRPLIRHDNKTTILLDRSICAPAFLEAMFSPLRKAQRKFDESLGKQIEAFLSKELHLHAIPTLTGKYRVIDGEGECDLVIETDDTIFLLEIKKKPLTRRASSGSDAHILIDLAQSLVDAQVQSGWHEVRLRRDGFLDLEHSGLKTRLNWRNRQIERIAVSLLDFGSFQDRLLLERFLLSTIDSEFSSTDISLKTRFAKINASYAELRQQMKLLHDPDRHLPFFHCWFLSLPQLLILLDGVTGPAAFKDALWMTRSIVTGTNDFYHDFAWWKKVKAQQA